MTEGGLDKWHKYESLICEMVDTPDLDSFIKAHRSLLKWAERNGNPPEKLLDMQDWAW
jgi:hypothetical protein